MSNPLSRMMRRLFRRDGTSNDIQTRDAISISAGGATSTSSASRDPKRRVISPILNRISVDASSVNLRHVRVNSDDLYIDDVASELNFVLSDTANLDQTGRAFLRDCVYSLLDEGVIAIVPVKWSEDRYGSITDVEDVRVGRVVTKYSRSVDVEVYNDSPSMGAKVVVRRPKTHVALIENPFYEVMNDVNATAERLIEKLHNIDVVDSNFKSNKLNILLHLPYALSGAYRENQAKSSVAELEKQMSDNEYGIGYVDSTQKITQLNRPIPSDFLEQVKYFSARLQGEFAISPAIFSGDADQAAITLYYNRTVFPILNAIAEGMTVKFVPKDRRLAGEKIDFFPDLFKMAPIADIAAAADVLSRNEITSANDIRGVIGLRPSKDPRANELNNANMPDEGDVQPSAVQPVEGSK